MRGVHVPPLLVENRALLAASRENLQLISRLPRKTAQYVAPAVTVGDPSRAKQIGLWPVTSPTAPPPEASSVPGRPLASE